MLEFSWKVFSMTGNIDTYLLMKEMERESEDNHGPLMMENQSEIDTSTN
ncbi:YqzL family protein [Anaerobacillus sp. MEB173]